MTVAAWHRGWLVREIRPAYLLYLPTWLQAVCREAREVMQWQTSYERREKGYTNRNITYFRPVTCRLQWPLQFDWRTLPRIQWSWLRWLWCRTYGKQKRPRKALCYGKCLAAAVWRKWNAYSEMKRYDGVSAAVSKNIINPCEETSIVRMAY
jgi:hypothetical protein